MQKSFWTHQWQMVFFKIEEAQMSVTELYIFGVLFLSVSSVGLASIFPILSLSV